MTILSRLIGSIRRAVGAGPQPAFRDGATLQLLCKRFNCSERDAQLMCLSMDPKVMDAALLRLIRRRYTCTDSDARLVLDDVRWQMIDGEAFLPVREDGEVYPDWESERMLDICASKVGLRPTTTTAAPRGGAPGGGAA